MSTEKGVEVGQIWKAKAPRKERVRVERVWDYQPAVGAPIPCARCWSVQGGRPLVINLGDLRNEFDLVPAGEAIPPGVLEEIANDLQRITDRMPSGYEADVIEEQADALRNLAKGMEVGGGGERARVLAEIRALAPHEVPCDCPAQGSAELDQHADECPRGAVGAMLDALARNSALQPPAATTKELHMSDNRRLVQAAAAVTTAHYGNADDLGDKIIDLGIALSELDASPATTKEPEAPDGDEEKQQVGGEEEPPPPDLMDRLKASLRRESPEDQPKGEGR